ncbi:MAG: hypothetical protein US94_C0035G0011 [Berkelbacteria bacterium GW2011_GWB1_38_5]|uniref:Uncharacterized protein n=2 Tax=Candidatus Berkelbacteria TaxID=1618330 RepID=A0A0G0LFZ8_9BACT|nr:MAG: hypothetical protein US94_C0035G0011 [Berkelbacteria bacterium GW2011_GWB1_38_5]KKQ90788.1 MAG: hypothetical protein UT15_C0004G0011 [Berkelbacteria bacterium GW2011_GWA1_39_10]
MKKDLRSEFLKTMTQFVTAAFAFVAALAWNDTIKNVINRFIEPGSGLKSQIIYAFFVTILAVLVTYYFGRITQEAKEEEEKKEHEHEYHHEKK